MGGGLMGARETIRRSTQKTYSNVTSGAHQNRFMAAPTSSPSECDMQIVPKLLWRASFV